VYIGYVDGHAPALRVADGQVLGVIDNVAGQP
jgi:hypothetical protein